MYLNKSKLIELMNRQFEGKYRQFARALNVEVSQLHRIINSDSQAGIIFLGKLYKYCKSNKIPFEQFIFFS
ncbi:transcriptional regulator [Lysinibacillus sp. SGAir0095]|nr:transcriptional regulator [Lysinibacillus sp. SGAir0095]